MRFAPAYAEYAVEFVQNLKHGDDFYGQPFILLPWQREAVETFYGTLQDDTEYRQYQYLYLETPKKNGKSEIAAGLGLFHLFADEAKYGEVYVVAADKQNASIIFNAAVCMLEQAPALLKRAIIRESTKEIIDRESKTKLKVMSSEAYSKHGYKPTCVIFDELHAQPNRELWDVMTFGAGSARKQPVWIVLTTAGDDPDRKSIGWEIHEKARKIRDYRLGITDGNYDNLIWLPYIYGLPDDPEKCKDIDIYDESLWYQCNPSLGVTIPISVLRQEALDARQSEASERLFRWLRLNQWIAIKNTSWVPQTVYDKAEKDIPREKLKGMRCYLGQDLSSVGDLTAVVQVFPPQAGLDHWHTVFYPYIPEENIKARSRQDHVDYRAWEAERYIAVTAGDCVDYDSIEADVVRLVHEYNAKMLGTDPWNSSMLVQRLQQSADKLQIIEISQSMAGMTEAMKMLERLLRKGEMTHEKNPVARWNFGNVRCAIDGNENMKPMKNKSIDRIDIIVAWIIAIATAIASGEKVDINAAILSEDWSL